MERKINALSGNALKLIATASMLCDHIGMLLFPSVTALRIIGRLAFPIFAFLISEGCRHTKNKLRYFLSVFTLALACHLAYSLYTKDTLLNVLVTFSFSILVCYILEALKKSLFSHTSPTKICIYSTLLLIMIALVYAVDITFEMEYGFVGCMLAPLASLNHAVKDTSPALSRYDKPWISALIMGVGILALAAVAENKIQFFALCAIPLLLLYSGKRGRLRLKWLFYIFYPIHLLILYAIAILTVLF